MKPSHVLLLGGRIWTHEIKGGQELVLAGNQLQKHFSYGQGSFVMGCITIFTYKQ